MCTMSWFRRADGYDLLFNRDEKRERPAAQPPALRRVGRAEVAAPLDPQAGGSWLAVNADGLTVALLNGYHGADAGAPPPGGWTSRGLLVMRLADSRGPEMALRRLDALDLTPFRSFDLALIGARDERFVCWADGRREIDPPALGASPLISSSFRTEEVRAARRESYRAAVAAASDPLAAALAFHRSHVPDRGPHSPCMHRPDARTVSFSWIRVDGGEARFRYSGDAPCRGWPPVVDVRLPRRVPAQ